MKFSLKNQILIIVQNGMVNHSMICRQIAKDASSLTIISWNNIKEAEKNKEEQLIPAPLCQKTKSLALN